MDQWTNTNYIEHVRERQAALQKEAKRQQLLRDLPDSPKRFTLFRKVVLVTGNLLIATGLWLKRRRKVRAIVPQWPGVFLDPANTEMIQMNQSINRLYPGNK